MQRGWGGGEDWFTEGQKPNYDSVRFKGLLRYHKPHVTDYAHWLLMFNTQTAYIAAYIRIYVIIYSVV